MTFTDPPQSAAWQHRDARDGFEVVFFRPLADGGFQIAGHTSAVEAGVAWAVGYEIDVDLESSALTNAFPVHRLGLSVGDGAEAPAVYIRAADLAVERLEQQYVRVDGPAESQEFDYAAPAFGFETRLVYDESGLVTAYPGLAARIA